MLVNPFDISYYLKVEKQEENWRQNLIYNALQCSIGCNFYQATSEQMQSQKVLFPPTDIKTILEQPTEAPLNPSNAYELQLISQYLDFNQRNISKPFEQLQDPSKKRAAKDYLPVIQNETSRGGQAEQDPKIGSSFHNFQKHLINTLKNSIKLKKIQCIEKSRLRIAYQLWEYFTTSSKSTKKLLYSILGDNLINNSELKKTPNSQASELFDLLAETDEEEVRASQAYLKNAILKQSKNLLKGKLLKGRRMHRSQDFKSYFQNFVKEMEEGMMLRRIPKQRKKNILQNNPTSTSM